MLDFDPMEAGALTSSSMQFENFLINEFTNSELELTEEDSFKTI